MSCRKCIRYCCNSKTTQNGATGATGIGLLGATGATGTIGATGVSGVNNFVNMTNFVDAVFGNNATAVPQDQSKPYQTINAALAAAFSGWVIYVRPGMYIESIILRDNIDFYFQTGSILTNVPGQTIFTDNNGPVLSEINGQGIFHAINGTASIIILINNSSNVTIKGSSADTAAGPLYILEDGTINSFIDSLSSISLTGSPGILLKRGVLKITAKTIMHINAAAKSDLFQIDNTIGSVFLSVISQELRALNLATGAFLNIINAITTSSIIIFSNFLNSTGGQIISIADNTDIDIDMQALKIVGGHPKIGAFVHNGNGPLSVSTQTFNSTSFGTQAIQLFGPGSGNFTVQNFDSDGGLLRSGLIPNLRTIHSYKGNIVVSRASNFPSIIIDSGIVSIDIQIFIFSNDSTTFAIIVGGSGNIQNIPVFILSCSAVIGSSIIQGIPFVQNFTQLLNGGQSRMVLDVVGIPGVFIDTDDNTLKYIQAGQVFTFFPIPSPGTDLITVRGRMILDIANFEANNINDGAILSLLNNTEGDFRFGLINANVNGNNNNIVRMNSNNEIHFEASSISFGDPAKGNILFNALNGISDISIGTMKPGNGGASAVSVSGTASFVGSIGSIFISPGISSGNGIEILNNANVDLTIRNINTRFGSAILYNSFGKCNIFVTNINVDDAIAAIDLNTPDDTSSSTVNILTQSINSNTSEYAVLIQGRINLSLRAQQIITNARKAAIGFLSTTQKPGTVCLNIDHISNLPPLNPPRGYNSTGIIYQAISGISDCNIFTSITSNADSNSIGYLITDTATIYGFFKRIVADTNCLNASTNAILKFIIEDAQTLNGSVILINRDANTGSYTVGGRFQTPSDFAIEYIGPNVPLNNHLNPSTLVSLTNSIMAPAGILTVVTENSLANTNPDAGISFIPNIPAYSTFGLIVVDTSVI